MLGSVPENYLSKHFIIMLRKVLNDYLGSIKDERDFDYPLISLLRAMGFYDIHFTHGSREIGKDFIAKKIIGDVEYQYAIQSKKGDVNQQKFTAEIYAQLLLASISGLSHPQFDKSLPRRVVLVTTGRLVGNAPLLFQDLNNELETTYQREAAEFWGKEQLIDLFEEHGLSSIHQFTAKGVGGYAQFLQTYSSALDGTLSDKEIEAYSRLWLDKDLEYRKRVLGAATEAEIIGTKLAGNGLLYEAVITYMSLARVVLQVMFENNDVYTVDVYEQIIEENLLPLTQLFHTEFINDWEANEKRLLLLVEKVGMPMLHYLVWCSRVLELNSLYFFLTKDQAEKAKIISFLIEFIKKEEGCGHIPSDRYAVSLVWTTLALLQSGKHDEAKELVKHSVIWLCDRVEKGFGLAHYDADEYEETTMLVGYPFDFIKVHQNNSSYLATVLSDLAAFMGDKEFYSVVVNDFEACEIAYNYWQFPDTEAIFTIDTEECITYPNIPHQYSLNDFNDFEYAEHIKHEPQSFQITQKAGLSSLILLSTLLKDRYFPKMWKQIISQNGTVNNFGLEAP
jgi:hypothetical protein